jgi:DNA replication protein DnaC
MNLQHDRIAGLCMQLKLDCVARDWGTLAQHAATRDASLGDFLEQLLQAEFDAREERKRQTLTKLASLPGIKTLEQYDFGFTSGALTHGAQSALREQDVAHPQCDGDATYAAAPHQAANALVFFFRQAHDVFLRAEEGK